MIITVVCDVLGEENNGTTIAALNLIRFLKSKGHEVRILCADQDKKGQANFYITPNLNLGKLLNAYVKKAGVSLAKADKEVINQAFEGTELVHFMLPGMFPFMLSKGAFKIAKAKGLPITAGFHMMAEIFSGYIKMNKIKPLNNFMYKHMYKCFYKYVDKIHYPTKFIQKVFENKVKHATPGVAISNGVHSYVEKKTVQKPEEFKDKFVIISTGRYAREKLQDTIIKALKYSKHKEDIQLILAGQGTREKYYKKLAKNLPVPPVMHFFERSELVEALNYADMYVHAGDVEIEGIACLESIRCGKLVVASDSKCSAPSEFAIDEKCVFKTKKPKDLARVIDYWFENPEERKKYENLYLNSGLTQTQEECMLLMEQMFRDVINEKKEQ